MKALSDTIADVMPDCPLVIPELAPVFGAVMLAMDRMGIEVTEAIMEKFKQEGGNRP